MLARIFARPADLKTRAERRGRAAVVWGLLFFVGLQAGFYVASDWWPSLADGEYGHKLSDLRAQLAAKPKDQPCVVMFGSSMTGWALDPAAMTNLKPGSPGGPVVFNFGVNGCGPIVHLLCLRRLLADGVRPDLVLLETEPRFMSRIYSVVYSEHYLQTPRVQYQDFPVLKRYDPKVRELRPSGAVGPGCRGTTTGSTFRIPTSCAGCRPPSARITGTSPTTTAGRGRWPPALTPIPHCLASN